MPLDQVTCRQGTYGLYSTLLEDIFLNEKHTIFLKSLILIPCLKIFKHDCRLLINFQKYPNLRNLLEPSPRKGSTKRCYHIDMNIQTYSQPPSTTQQKE